MLKGIFERILLEGCIVIALTGISYGQGVYEAWVVRYNGPANSTDEARALAVDDSGYVYVSGMSTGITSGPDYTTIKYTPDGDTVWVRRYNGPGNMDDCANAVSVDSSGNVYVTGSSWDIGTSGFATIKYTPTGDMAWVTRYNGTANYGNGARELMTDDNGNIYVAGMSSGSETFSDWLTIKYLPSGDTAWVRYYTGAGFGLDWVNDLVADNNGNVYVTGVSSSSGTSASYTTIKYLPGGDTAWIRHYKGPGDNWNVVLALAVDDSGFVYVTGVSNGVSTGDDYATIKYAPNGDTVWVRRYNGLGNAHDGAYALAVDGSGNVYVTGTSAQNSVAPYNHDYVTIKYAPNGDTVWVRRFNGPDNSDDVAAALALDGAGNIYVSGYSYGNGSSEDYATIKYEPDGDIAWIKRYNGLGNGSDFVYAMTVDNSSNVYVAGFSYGSGGSYDYATIKYASCAAIPGDVDNSDTITIADILHLVNYIFNKPAPPCQTNCWPVTPFCRGDVTANGTLTLGDIIYLVNYIFDKDRFPCLGTDPGNCWTPEVNGACCLAVP